jgi:muramoyltetrapeptide carboxypeptidase LdcA involved in peptidoglycan recycling
MIKPAKLRKGDKVAVVSLSSDMIGDKEYIHKFYLGKQRLEQDFGLEVVAMPNALKGSKYLFNHPKARAEDLMNALKDNSIKAIICSIGGEDTYRLLPYIDFEVIKNNPKIFMGFSDSTINHLMFYKAGVTSFYGPCLMCNFAEYGDMFEYEKDAVKNLLFSSNSTYEIKPSKTWTYDSIWWKEENINKHKTLYPDTKGYEILQGKGVAKGKLLGGCLESLCAMLGYFEDDWYDGNHKLGLNAKTMSAKYDLFPKKEEWKDKILFIETSECQPTPQVFDNMLQSLIDYGIIENINGIIVGKPKEEKFYEEYKQVLRNKIGKIRPNLPIIYNVNFGHASPINIIPYGIECELNCKTKKITLLENCLKDN